jgi:Putative MetA-pathway of phenol degradation
MDDIRGSRAALFASRAQAAPVLLYLALLALAAADARGQTSGAPFSGRLFAPRVRAVAPQGGGDEEDEVKPGRPGVANPAEIQKPGVLQLEMGYEALLRARDVRTAQSVPLTLRYAAAKRLLLEVNLDAVKSETDEETRTRLTGVGDTRVGFQFVALEDAPEHPALAFAYYVKIPTADAEKGLGTGRFDHKLVGLLSRKAGETDIDFNVAYLLVGKEGGGGWEHGGQGALSVSRDFQNNFGFEAELSGQSHDDVLPRGVFALGALRYKASRRAHFDAGARFGLTAEAPRVGLFAGVTVGLTRPREE